MNTPHPEPDAERSGSTPSNFIREIIDTDLVSGKYQGRVHTRFPPEPNGYLHIGHAKSICLNFGIARDYDGGKCNLRFDDTNPAKEEVEYVESIQNDVRWLGFEWNEETRFASGYFDALYGYAVALIEKGAAYVDSLTAEEIREYRGTPSSPGRNSPHRDRSVEENLDLFARMKGGEFDEGAHVLRAKIDMASPNFNMRDPTIYRIKKVAHHRTGDAWCIYPMYDFAHGLSDSIEGITHSICTLEFENHRPLYDWILEKLDVYRPQQIEFARLSLSYTVMSKRKLLRLVKENFVRGWDDPRMPTLAGLRRRGYTSASIRMFCDRIGVARYNSVIDIGVLEGALRDDLNDRAERRMAVLHPLKVVIENYPEGVEEELDVANHPGDPTMGTRKVPFCREVYIEQEDFMEDPPKKFFRLGPGREVRLRAAYYITCTDVIKDAAGNVVELRCTYDPESRGGGTPDGRKVKGTLHWVSAKHAVDTEVRLYESLFSTSTPDAVEEGGDFVDNIRTDSLEILSSCKLEPVAASAPVGTSFQFERIGYFVVDSDSDSARPVFNRSVSLRDAWAKEQQRS